MKNFSVFDNNFSASKLSSYTLLIQYDAEGLSYAIVDTIRKQYLAQVRRNFNENYKEKSELEKLKSILETENYLSKRYKSVNFIYTSPRYTLVPGEFFDKKTARKIFELNHYLADNEEVHFNELKNNIYNLFVLPSDFIVYLVDKFPEIKFFNQSSPLINHVLTSHKIFINFMPGFIDIAVYKDGKLQLANNYKLITKDDALFFIPKILKELKIPFSINNLEVGGDIEDTEKIWQNLIKILPNAKLFFNYQYNFKIKIPKHYLAGLNFSILVN